MTHFVETHQYLHLTTATGRRLFITRAYVRQLEEASGGGTYITVADQASTRHVTQSIDEIMAILTQGTVRYSADV